MLPRGSEGRTRTKKYLYRYGIDQSVCGIGRVVCRERSKNFGGVLCVLYVQRGKAQLVGNPWIGHGALPLRRLEGSVAVELRGLI